MLARSLILTLLLIQAVRAEVIDISIDEMQSLMTSDDIVVIDVRTPREWQQTGIVAGSLPIMFFDERRKPLAQEWLDQASAHIASNQELILICRTGNRSKIIANYLTQQHGYERVYNVKKGITQWLRLGHKTVAPP